MKARELKPIFDVVKKRFSNLDYHKTFLFLIPFNGILRGIDLDASAFSKESFTVCAFFMPLCVPSECLTLTFGRRVFLKNGSWSMLSPNLADQLSKSIDAEALPFLSRAPTLRDFAATPELYYGNPHGPKAAAYALARIGETKQAIAMIEDYLPRLDLSSHWQKEIDEESRALRHLLIYEPALAAAKLEEWESETIRNLGLERFR